MFHKLLSRVAPLLVLMALVLSISASYVNQVDAAGGFVARAGNHFVLNGKPWYVAGTNNHYLGWGSQAEIDNVLNDAKAMHFNVVRTILHSVRGSLDGSVPTKWNWTSNGDTGNMGMHNVYILYWNPKTKTMAFNDSTTDGLGRWDYVIWKAGQLGLKLDISLLDFWQWAGGVQQINADFKGGNYDMSSAADRYTFFFQDPRTKAFYKAWVNHVLNRMNTLTHVAYKNDPTIFAWDLMNEPEIGGTALGQSWITEMATYVKALDRNHMLDSGSEGFADAHVGTSVALDAANPHLDFASFHTYPAYHGISASQVISLIDQNCAVTTKPVVMQEFGYSFANSNQASVYQSWVDELYNKNCGGWTFWRLTAKESTGSYPPDNGEGFDIHNDGSASANVLINAAIRSASRGPAVPAAKGPLPTKTPVPAKTKVPGRTFQPPTNTPAPKTKPPVVPPTKTPVPTKPPVSAGQNIAPSGHGYTWFNITASYAGNQRTEPGVNDGNLTGDFALSGGGDDNPAAGEAAGVVWSAPQTIKSVKYYNGSCDKYQNGPFTGGVAIQFSTDGVNWKTDTTWKVSPAYPVDSCGKSPTADQKIFTFAGPAKTGVMGVRIIGTVRTTDKSLAWHALAREVQVYN